MSKMKVLCETKTQNQTQSSARFFIPSKNQNANTDGKIQVDSVITITETNPENIMCFEPGKSYEITIDKIEDWQKDLKPVP